MSNHYRIISIQNFSKKSIQKLRRIPALTWPEGKKAGGGVMGGAASQHPLGTTSGGSDAPGNSIRRFSLPLRFLRGVKVFTAAKNPTPLISLKNV